MTSAFGTMNQILKYFEKNLDNDVFETETFGENRFNISENRFARYLKMLLDSEYIEGLKVIDYGEPDFPNQENYHRFKIVLDEPCITIRGLRFLAENTVLAKTYKVVKDIGGIIK